MMQDNADLLALVRTIPDFPKPGIQFRDITTLIHNGWGLRTAIDRMATASAPYQPTLVAGIEARGFIFGARSEEHTSELQSLMRISYAVFCLKKNTNYILLYSFIIPYLFFF